MSIQNYMQSYLDKFEVLESVSENRGSSESYGPLYQQEFEVILYIQLF